MKVTNIKWETDGYNVDLPTDLPTEEDIVSDLNYGVGVDDTGYYYNNWGVTDNYNSDSVLDLNINEDFVEAE